MQLCNNEDLAWGLAEVKILEFLRRRVQRKTHSMPIITGLLVSME